MIEAKNIDQPLQHVAEHYVSTTAENKILRNPNKPLVLVNTAAGYGKKTLANYLAEHHSQNNCKVVRLSLSKNSTFKTILKTFSSNNNNEKEKSYLIIENAEHLVCDGQSCDLLNSTLALCKQLILVSRTELSIPLHEYWLQNKILHVDYRDFELDFSQVKRIADSMALDVSENCLQLLVDKLEGWAAGILLAFNYAACSANAERFLQNFHYRFAPFYALMESYIFEPLDQDCALRIMQTAPCGQVNLELLDVLGCDDPSAMMLKIRSACPYLRPDSGDTNRFTYSPFFIEYAEYRAQQHKLLDKTWFEKVFRYLQRNFPYAAMEFTVRHGNAELAARLLLKHGPSLIFRYALSSVYIDLYRLLGAKVTYQYPLLSALYNFSLAMNQRATPEDLRDSAVATYPLAPGDQATFARYDALKVLVCAYHTQGTKACPTLALDWLKKYPNSPIEERALVSCWASAMYRWEVAFTKASQQLIAAEKILQHYMHEWPNALIHANKCFLAEEFGNGRSSVTNCKEEFAGFISKLWNLNAEMPRLWPKSKIIAFELEYCLPFAFLYCDLQDYNAAEKIFAECWDSSALRRDKPHTAAAYLAAARIHANRNKVHDAIDALDQGIINYRSISERLVIELFVYRIAILLRFGLYDLASDFAKREHLLDCSLSWLDDHSVHNRLNIDFCRLQLAVFENSDDVPKLAKKIIKCTKKHSWYRREIQTKALHAQWLYGREEKTMAHAMFNDAVNLAESREMPAVPLEMDFGSLQACSLSESDKQQLASSTPCTRDTDNLLSPRELEVLKLVREGLSNRQIGCQLNLSEKTIKWYLNKTFDKLQVRRRTAAVSRASSLNLI